MHPYQALYSVWTIIPIVITFIFFFLLVGYWKKQATAKGKIEHDTSTYKELISTAFSATAIILPIICAAIGYLASLGNLPTPLIASALVISFSILIGLFNIFSLTVANNGKITITQTDFYGFPAQVTCQFIALGSGLIIACIYILFLYTTTPTTTQQSINPGGFLVSKPILRIDTPKSDILSSWGQPASSTTNKNTTILIYDSNGSRFEMELESDKLTTFKEVKK